MKNRREFSIPTPQRWEVQSWRKRWKAQEELETLLIEECAASKSFEWLVGGNGQPCCLLPRVSPPPLYIFLFFPFLGCMDATALLLPHLGSLIYLLLYIYIHIRYIKKRYVYGRVEQHTRSPTSFYLSTCWPSTFSYECYPTSSFSSFSFIYLIHSISFHTSLFSLPSCAHVCRHGAFNMTILAIKNK